MPKLKEPRDWWQVHPDDWSPIAAFADHDGGPVVFANSDKSRTWLSMSGVIIKSSAHELAEGSEDELVEGEDAAFWATV